MPCLIISHTLKLDCAWVDCTISSKKDDFWKLADEILNGHPRLETPASTRGSSP
jgi:hypothetical protein